MSDITFDIIAKDKASGTFKNVGKSAESGGHSLQKFAEFAKKSAEALALYEGAKIAAEAIKSVAEAAIDDQAAQRKLALALKNTTGANKEQTAAVSEWLTKQAEAYGVSKDQLMPAFQRLAESSHSVAKAQKELTLAQNISAGTGKDLGLVSMALTKANNGNVSALGRLGLKVKDAKGHTLGLRDALNGLAQTFKGQAEARANSLQGQFDRLSATTQELKVKIGDKLLPVISKLAAFVLNQGIPAVQKLSTWLGTKLGPVVTKLSAFFTNTLVPAVKTVITWIRDQLVPVVVKLATSVFGSLMGAVNDVKSHLHNLGPFITLVEAAFKGVWNIISNVLAPVLEKLYGHYLKMLGKEFGVLIDVLGKVSQAAIWLWNNGFQPAIQFIVKGIGFLINVWAHMLDALGHIPGFGWASDAAKGLYAAAKQANTLANQILQIPDHKTITISIVQVVYKPVKAAAYGAGAGVLDAAHGGGSPVAPKPAPTPAASMFGPSSSFGNSFSNAAGKAGGSAGGSAGKGIAKGLSSAQSPIKNALAKIKTLISTELTKISNLQQLKAGFLSTFSSNSIFGADMSTTSGIGGLIAMQQDQATQAQQLMADIRQVASMGLSKSLISQLQSQGTSGAAALHALAGGTAAQIGQLNSLDAMTQASLQSAGLLAGNAQRGGNVDSDIAAAKRELAAEQRLEKVLSKLHLTGSLKAQGTELIAVIKATNRSQGKTTAGL
jgi:hypothetical protein